MNNQFDELAKNMALSVTRRAALKKFGLGLAGIAFATFGLADKAKAGNGSCVTSADCPNNRICVFGRCRHPSKKSCNNCVGTFGCSDTVCANVCNTLCQVGA